MKMQEAAAFRYATDAMTITTLPAPIATEFCIGTMPIMTMTSPSVPTAIPGTMTADPSMIITTSPLPYSMAKTKDISVWNLKLTAQVNVMTALIR